MVPLLHPALPFLQIQKQRRWRYRPPSAPSPLAAAEVLCSGGSQCYQFKWVKARDEWRKNKVRRGRFGLYNLRPLLLLSCTNHRCPLAPPRPWQRRRRFSSAELIASHRNGSHTVVDSERIGGGGADWSWNTTINPWRRRNHLPSGAQARRRRKEKEKSDFSFPSSDAEAMAFVLVATQQSTRGGAAIQTIYALGKG